MTLRDEFLNRNVAIIVPLYNEERVIEKFHEQLCHVITPLAFSFKIYYVNDGSSDRTHELLDQIAEQDSRVIVIELSRNFGHQAALTAGLDQAQGDILITMDGDGQHPAELIPEMLDLHQRGYDIVLTQRIDKEQPSRFKRWTAALFYGLLNRIGDTHIIPGSADFRLLSRSAVDGLKQMREYHRFLRGMVAWMGYRTVILPYLPPERLGGVSKYSFKKMVNLALNAVFSFSLVPLRIGISLGLIFLILAGLEVIYVLSFWVRGQQNTLEPGWSSLMFMLLLVGGILMLSIGFIGMYVGYIFQEVKHRPIYLVRNQPSSSAIQEEANPDPPSK